MATSYGKVISSVIGSRPGCSIGHGCPLRHLGSSCCWHPGCLGIEGRSHRIGHGSQAYSCRHYWCTLPAEQRGSQSRPWSACNGTMYDACCALHSHHVLSAFGSWDVPGNFPPWPLQAQWTQSARQRFLSEYTSQGNQYLTRTGLYKQPRRIDSLPARSYSLQQGLPSEKLQFSCLECAVLPALSNQSLSRSRRAADCTAAGQGADWQTRSTRKERSY